MRLISEIVAEESRLPLLRVGLIQSTENLNRPERLSERGLHLPDLLDLGNWSFVAFSSP
jgi:hypothetical protein